MSTNASKYIMEEAPVALVITVILQLSLAVF